MSNASPLRAAIPTALQLSFCVGGLGYAWLRQWRKAALTFGGVLALVILDAIAATMGWMRVCYLLAPIIVAIQATTALDAWRIARGAA